MYGIQKYFTYLAFGSMGSSMHYTEEWLHGGQLLESRKDTCSFLHVRPVLASHIHGEELGFGWHEFLLKIQGVGEYLPPVHI